MRRTALLKILWVFRLVAVCRGALEIWAVNPHESTCAGETVSFQAEVTGAEAEFVIEWSDKNSQFLDDSEHFSLNENKTVLTISNALPPHAGLYYVAVKYANESVFDTYETFQLEVQDIQLHTLVKSPVKIEFGGKGVLKVNKSAGGDLFWIHKGNLIQVSLDDRYAFVDEQGLGTELEISDATAEQGGLYEVVLMKGGCQVRNIIDVQIQEIVEDTEAAPTEDTKFWGIIDSKYLGFFSGDFTGEWYIVPLVLGPVVILLLVLVVCVIRRSRSEKSSKRDKSEMGVTHVVFEDPIYSVQDQVFYPSADPTYDIEPLTSSHPQSSSLGTYGDFSMYDTDDDEMSPYESFLGPTVPPPAPGLEQTSSESDLDYFSD